MLVRDVGVKELGGVFVCTPRSSFAKPLVLYLPMIHSQYSSISSNKHGAKSQRESVRT